MTHSNECWILSYDSTMSGSMSQAIGLAEALQLDYSIKPVALKSFWYSIPIQLIPHKSWVFQKKSLLTTPFPKWVIASAKRTIPAAIAIKKSSPNTKIIYLQNPRHYHRYFDAIITPYHDKDERYDSIKSLGALHRASRQSITAAKDQLPLEIQQLPNPIHVFLIGGNARSHLLDKQTLHQLIQDMEYLLTNTDGSIAILPSRRTPHDARKQFHKFQQNNSRAYFWDSQAPSPYLGLLGYADHLIVTEESVSMISEACSTGVPTHIYPLKRRRNAKRLALFHQAIIQSQKAKIFTLPLKRWQYEALNETERVAALVRRKLEPDE